MDRRIRALFGDESVDYAESLQRHYAHPTPDWPQHFVSVYASSHPWEDWAETWAHYLHMVDGLETAAAWGLSLAHALPTGPALAAQPLDIERDNITATVIEQWLPVSQFINAMDRSLGSQDSYPFILVGPVVQARLRASRGARGAARRHAHEFCGGPHAGTGTACGMTTRAAAHPSGASPTSRCVAG